MSVFIKKWFVLSCFVMSIGLTVHAISPAEQAKSILKETNTQGGLVVHVGCQDGQFATALHADERYLVHALCTARDNVKAVRARIKEKNLYGHVSAEFWDPSRLPYADNLVNLLVVEPGLNLPKKELFRVLMPGGTLFFRGRDKGARQVKPRADSIDEWTHYLHDADNNAVAQDTRVMPPKHLQWKAGPMWCRSHEFASSITCMVSAKHRIYMIVDEGIIGQPRGVPPQWKIVAREAFNGKLLWKREIDQGQKLQRLFVADGGKLYTPLGPNQPVLLLDGATGKIRHTLKGTDRAGQMVVHDGKVIVVKVDDKKRRRSEGASGTITAYDGKNGKERWQKPIKNAKEESLAAANGHVFYHNGDGIVALRLRNGEKAWSASCGFNRHLLVYRGAVIVSARGGLQAFDAETGAHLWSGPRATENLFGAQGLIWVDVSHTPGRNVAWTSFPFECVGLDPRTGETKRELSVKNILSPGHHPRCYRGKATERFLLQNKRGVEYVDLAGDSHMRHDWLRAPCRHGFVPANGLLYMPPHQCFCYAGARLSGFNVMSGESVNLPAIADKKRLAKGPAWGNVEITKANKEDWPVYRHDAQRKGSTQTQVSANLNRLWQYQASSKLTAPVVANGKLFVAEEDAHTIHCLNAQTGEPVWEFTARGRIDSAPTLYQGRVLFGSGDGRVYCLRASDGRLVWRFMAAPHERRIVVFDRLESAWPVHGSVVVQNGKVYFTAGRSSYLDGGIYAYALDPATGELLHQTRIESQTPDVEEDIGRPFDMDGTRSDILVGDGQDLYMFHEHLKPDLTRVETPRVTRMGDYDVGLHLMCNDGFLDKTWFNRSYWSYSRRWPGFYFTYRASKSGQILVIGDRAVYGVKAFTHRHGHSPEYTIGSGYTLFADAVDNEPVLLPHAIGRDKSEGYSRSAPSLWSTKVPLRVLAMVKTKKHLFIAGPPDTAPKDDPLAAFEGRMGAKLWCVSAASGEKLAEYDLNTLPIFDGLIAANGRLYLVTADGRILCME